MPRISGQIFVYLVVAAVVVLVGFNSIRGEKTETKLLGKMSGSAAGGAGDPSEAAGEISIGAGSRKLVVDVAGAVRRPGVYRLSRGARVLDAIKRAGGATRGALLGSINRAATLSDGQQVVVPSLVSGAPGGSGGGRGSGPVGTGRAGGIAPVNLGTATQEQLEEIDGIGPVTAQKILEFRDSRGGLGSVEELDQVSGIGPVTMESLRSALAP